MALFFNRYIFMSLFYFYLKTRLGSAHVSTAFRHLNKSWISKHTSLIHHRPLKGIPVLEVSELAIFMWLKHLYTPIKVFSHLSSLISHLSSLISHLSSLISHLSISSSCPSSHSITTLFTFHLPPPHKYTRTD
jgi:hypothetical protein